VYSRFLINALAALLALSVGGCASAPPKAGESAASGADPAPLTASAVADPVPVPVEILPDPSAKAPKNARPRQARANDDESEPSPSRHGRSRGRYSRPVLASACGKADGNVVDYVVRGGDTLMKISFNLLGNVYRWREIYKLNRPKVASFTNLARGTHLQVNCADYIVVERDGLPYLIRRNDTLIKISGNVYGTPYKWRRIWENNRQLIHDPNRIYAGFTLYYRPEDGPADTAPRPLAKAPVPSGAARAPASPPASFPSGTPPASPSASPSSQP
jgi:nucleoid-associated protein YgaU